MAKHHPELATLVAQQVAEIAALKAKVGI